MALANSPHDGLHNTAIISSDVKMDERQSPTRKLRRKRPSTEFSYPMYEALFDDPAPSEMWQPPKRCKIPNLRTILGGEPFCVNIDFAQNAFPPLAQTAQCVIRLSLVLLRATKRVMELEMEMAMATAMADEDDYRWLG
ncbi:hypothetical protein EMCG_04386 [[Emmonsia] crescens]|uniref:Uncharacterized protein n=1 Tax=[Emmonsia] crescens TaxID=73230 RepID=A0A0G2HSH7_9EURO|nr:hypothetical protein EMCG_04386 [Emmonsia crescens UAMH 3008]